jgi:GST-like protein
MTLKLYAARWGGSMIVEAGFALAGIAPKTTYAKWGKEGVISAGLKKANPLAQVPTLILDDGTILTESAAILLWLNDLKPETGLVPAPGHPARARFFRWLMVINAAIYPTFSYGDYPARWLNGHAEAAPILRRNTDRHRENLWRHIETQIDGPWFLGETFSALDLYVWVMRYWRPGKDWFAAEAPKLLAIAARLDKDKRLQAVLARQRA